MKRVVITSSFASVLDEAHLEDPNHTFTEASWNPSGLSDIHKSPMTAYRVSKKLAEKAAWDFVATEKPGWDLVTLCPPLVLGPVALTLAALGDINTSNLRVADLLEGKWKEEIPSQGIVSIWIDVRDLARAHVAAVEKPEAGGKRLFPTAGYFCNREVSDAVRKNFPGLKHRLPGPEVKGGERPDTDKSFKWDVSETNKLLAIEYIKFEKSIVDLVNTLKGQGYGF